MGLDMYLEKDTYIGAQFPHRGIEGEISLSRMSGKERVPINVQVDRVSSITEQVGYWRKANAIHKWFVDNCAKGVDECQRIYVDRDKMEDLLEIVTRVLSRKEEAERRLPTQSGFFFGDTTYDEWYYKDLEDTREILTNVLSEGYQPWVDYYYRASW